MIIIISNGAESWNQILLLFKLLHIIIELIILICNIIAYHAEMCSMNWNVNTIGAIQLNYMFHEMDKIHFIRII